MATDHASTNSSRSDAEPPGPDEVDDLEQWVRDFLASDGSDNAVLGQELAERDLHWVGPVELPFDELHRLAGPDGEPTLGEFDEDGLASIEAMCESIEDGWEPLPLVITYRGDLDQFIVEDGNHRTEALRRAGRTSHACVVGFESAEEARRVLDDATAA